MKMKKGWLWAAGVAGVLVVATIVVMVAQNFDGFLPKFGSGSTKTQEYVYDQAPKDKLEGEVATDGDFKMTKPSELDSVAASTPGKGASPAPEMARDMVKVNLQKADVFATKQMLMKNGSINIESDDPVKASQSCTEVAIRFGGDILNSNTSYTGQNAYVTMTLRVPVASFEKAMNELQKVGKATAINSTADDVTSEYINLETRQATIEKLLKKLNSLLDSARNEEAIVQMYERIASYEQELESILGQKKYLQGMTSFSRISVNISKPGEAIVVPTDNEFIEGLKFILRAFLTALMWIFVVLVVAIPITLFVLLIIWIVKLASKSGKPQA